MTEEKFEELVNSYLDNELTPEDFKILKEELESSFERRSIFVFYHRLHSASCSALLGKKVCKSREARKGRGQIGMKIYYLAQFGMAAACFVLAFVVLSPFFSNPNSNPAIVEFNETPPPLDLPLTNRGNEYSPRSTPAENRQTRMVIPAYLASLPDFKGLTLQPDNTGSDAFTATVHFFNRPDVFLGQVDFAENSSPPQHMQLQTMPQNRAFPMFEDSTASRSGRVILRNSREKPFRAELANFYFQR